MGLRTIFSCMAIAGIYAYPGQSYAQFAYEGMRQGIKYKIYIYDKQSLGNGKWEFQTKAVGFPRFRGHGSGVHRGECTGSDERLLVVDRTQVADR